LGQHLGNRFTITLREIVQVSSAITLTGKVEEGCIACPRARIEEAVERVRRNGFVNFFGEQRIGAIHVDPGTRAVDIGRAMLQQDWTKAVDVIMLIGTDASSLKVSRVWRESGRDVQATWKALAKSQGSQSRQRMLLQTLRRQGTDDCSVALKSLSYSERAFWINAYQSYVWNQAATARIRLYGSDKVKMGDLVQCQQNTSTGQPILVVSEEMAEQYSIRDVVLPLPGYRVQYPSNKVSQVYRDASICDGIEYVKDAPLDATAKGSYRPLVAVADNITSEWVDEDDQTVMTCRFMFDLPSGSYATMLIRELLRTNDACRETALEP
jgi:tRNA pseudouridine13 synthase